MVRKILARVFIVAVAICLAALTGIGYWGAGRLLIPKRRAVQAYQQPVLANPDKFGLIIRAYEGPRRTPCLLVEPHPTPGAAKKGRAVRDLLVRQHVKLGPWGQIRGTLFLLHGHTGRKEDNLTIAERFCAAGFRCILVDLPGHGEHPESLATFGKTECSLIEMLATDLKKRIGKDPGPLGLFGISQGGAISLQTAARGVKPWFAVISVSSFCSLDQPIALSARRIYPPLSPLLATTCGLGIRCRGGFSPEDISPLKAASQLKIPVFIVHGGKDGFIPPSQGREIYNVLKNPSKKLQIVPEGTHGDVLSKGGNAVYADMCAFYLNALR